MVVHRILGLCGDGENALDGYVRPHSRMLVGKGVHQALLQMIRLALDVSI
jgi:NAD(P)H-hydrate repair Nnr-like enzyme with NAD(P)H-hydrate epimerase domain